VDHQKIQEYFPLDVTTKGMFEIYEKILGLRYEKLTPTEEEIWHPDVELYAVYDRKSENLIGHFFLDLFPRDGKYGHAACFGLQPGCVDPNGERQVSLFFFFFFSLFLFFLNIPERTNRRLLQRWSLISRNPQKINLRS